MKATQSHSLFFYRSITKLVFIVHFEHNWFGMLDALVCFASSRYSVTYFFHMMRSNLKRFERTIHASGLSWWWWFNTHTHSHALTLQPYHWLEPYHFQSSNLNKRMRNFLLPLWTMHLVSIDMNTISFSANKTKAHQCKYYHFQVLHLVLWWGFCHINWQSLKFIGWLHLRHCEV